MAAAVPGRESLNGLIAKDKSHCLNEARAHSWQNLLGGGTGLQSDADEQLLLTISFNATVKLSSVVLGLPGNAACPATIKLFLNNDTLGFDEATDRAPVQQIVITDPATTHFEIQLQAVKWQRTDSITIFVQDNHGSDVSSITSINLYGASINGTDVSKIKGC